MRPVPFTESHSSPVAFVSSPQFADHALPPGLRDRAGGHPERPDRIRAVHAAVRTAGLLTSATPFPDFAPPPFDLGPGGPTLLELNPGPPVGDDVLLRVHTPEHLRRVAEVVRLGGGLLDADTYAGPESDEVARLAVAAAIRAGDVVMNGEAKRAFAAVRPPGHHAEPDRAMGFCLYATAAILVRHLQAARGVGRVAVIDFDVHHGNGTQAVFYDDPSVLAVSLHGDPRTLWPGTGFADEIGEGEGRGFTLNVPLPPGTADAAYLAALRENVLPRVRDFRPELIVAVAGFDAHAADPLANLSLSSAAFGQIGRELAGLADELCDGRLAATMEGGYDLTALGEGAVAFLRALGRTPLRGPLL